jgi:hypothetical protein
MTETISRAAVRQPTAEISVSTAARIAGCSADSVLRWIEDGATPSQYVSTILFQWLEIALPTDIDTLGYAVAQ